MGARTDKARQWVATLDRTAVLALGLVAGFAIGLSFNEAGRRQTFGWLTGETAPVPLPHTAAGVVPVAKPDPSRPELAALLSPTVVRRVARDGVVRVGVFGDSYGDGFWAALYHQLPARDHYEVLRFSKEATGFTRYRTLDLEERAKRQVAGQPIDIAVISFGANDIQPIFEGGHLRALMSPDWQAIIGARIDRFVAVARSTGAAVFWVGLPVMRDAQLDADVQAMNAFYEQRMKVLGVPFIATRAASVDAAGRFDRFLPAADGTPQLMRTNDGVHMTIPGYYRLTAAFAQRLRADVALLRAKAGMAPAPAPVAPAVAVPAPRPMPSPTPARPHDVHPRPVTKAPDAALSAPTPPVEAMPAPVPTANEPPAPPPATAASAAPDAEDGKTAKANRREQARERKRAAAAAKKDGAPAPAVTP